MYGEDKPNCCTAWSATPLPGSPCWFPSLSIWWAWRSLLYGKWMINELFRRLYYVLAAAIVIATILDGYAARRAALPGEGAEKSLVLCDGVDVVQPNLPLGHVAYGPLFQALGSSLDHLRWPRFWWWVEYSDPGVTEQCCRARSAITSRSVIPTCRSRQGHSFVLSMPLRQRGMSALTVNLASGKASCQVVPLHCCQESGEPGLGLIIKGSFHSVDP